jgi:hypothetical protein
MVAPDRAEVAITSLAECLAAVAHNQMLFPTGTHVSNGLPELLQAKAAVAVQRYIGAIALGQAGRLQQQQQRRRWQRD